MRRTSGEGEVALIAKQPLRERLPADEAAAVHLGDLADLIRPGRWPKVARHLRGDEHEPRDRDPFRGLQGE